MPETKAALITGAAKRLGKAIALHLAANGYDIALHFNSSQADADECKKEIEKLGRQCHLFQADLNNIQDVLPVVGKAKEKLPRLCLLINNASTFPQNKFNDTTPEQFDRNFNVHIKAPFFLTQEFAKHCRSGNVINILDTFVTSTAHTYFTYLLSKKTLHGFTIMAAAELAPDIRVNAIAPGSVISPEHANPSYVQERAKTVPLKMPGGEKYILQGIDYLLSNSFVTGECLFIDGGAHLPQNSVL